MKARRETKALSVGNNWAKYVAAGAACASVAVTAEQADADSYYSGILNQNMTAGAASSALITPLATAISNNVIGLFRQTWHTSGILGHAYFGAYGQVAGFTSGFLYAYNLHTSQTLSALNFNASNYWNTMAFHYGYGNDQFLNPGLGIVGFRFISPVEGTLHYGWARVNMTGAGFNGMTLVDWAYSDRPGFGAGHIPEPTSLGLLAAGALGVAAMRRNRRAA